MNNSRNNMPASSKDVCSAVCAIVHANIIENGQFKQKRSMKRTRFTSIKKDVFSDHGVEVEVYKGMINIKVHVSALIDQASILEKAKELQENIFEEVTMLTSFQVRKIDILIKSLI